MKKDVLDFFYYFNFLTELIKKDFKKKYYKSVLGVLWSILNPLCMMIIITIVFSQLFQRNIENYPVYYLAGSLVYNFYIGATKQSLHSITGNFSIIKKIYVPKYMFTLSYVGLEFVTFVFSLIPLILLMMFTGVEFTPYMLLLPVVIVHITLFTTGVSLMLAAYSTIFGDLKHLYGIFTTALMYLTPIFYPISIIPQKFLFLWELNPLYIYISITRDLLLYGTMPSEKMLFSAMFYSIVTIVMGFIVFKEQESKFMLYA